MKLKVKSQVVVRSSNQHLMMRCLVGSWICTTAGAKAASFSCRHKGGAFLEDVAASFSCLNLSRRYPTERSIWTPSRIAIINRDPVWGCILTEKFTIGCTPSSLVNEVVLDMI
jgi:hypothetical protein